MRTQEIPTYEWVSFLNQFTQRHAGEPATIEVMRRDVGVQKEADALPLVGVSVDATGDDREQIEVIAGTGESPDQGHVMHAIRQPSRLWLACGDDGAEQALEIESADGSSTLVRLMPH
jgi:hypothetical protein